MPESRFKYLYERLGDHQFQLLANALLTGRFADYVPLPLRQADGGRDGLIRGSKKSLVFQVKWSVRGEEKDPVKWLEAAIRTEEHNLRRLAKEGVRRYALVTNVSSTGKASSGTFDQMNDRLDEIAESIGIGEMSCIWREGVDGMVDNAPKELLWTYADMLAGWQLIRYMIDEDVADRTQSKLRKIVRSMAAAQWHEDETLKFSQADVDREMIADLFVDVNAECLKHVGSTAIVSHSVGGAAEFLMNYDQSTKASTCTLVRGAPGQGKSTLSQFISQVHRRAFLPAAERPDNLPEATHPLFPVRIDLSDYANWLSGVDIWATDVDSPGRRYKRRAGVDCTLESFIGALMTHHGGGISVASADVQELFELVPCMLVLDGLDEVGQLSVRKKVVLEIDLFASRNLRYKVPPKLIVTTRPSTNELPEPSVKFFEILVLSPLLPAQRAEYLRRWTKVHGIQGAAGRALRKLYHEKIAEPYLAELAGNPMQLTIMLDLLHKQGEATPTQRTALYDSYVDLLLTREANKHPQSVRNHQAELREIIPFLGWHLQAHSEANRLSSSMSVADLKATIRHFQRTYDNSEKIVDELFEAASDRLWALTSKVQGSYEFEVVSLREYFAARFLFRYAGEGLKGFDRLDVFREILRRPYWMNTARFYGGNAEVGQISELADGIVAEVSESPTAHSVISGWTLLTDGVFASRPRRARDVVAALCSDGNLAYLVEALARREISPLPDLPQPTSSGPDPTWDRLTDLLSKNPGAAETSLRVIVLRSLLNQSRRFGDWWSKNIARVCGDASIVDPWLEMASPFEAAAGLELDLHGTDLSRPLVAQRILDSGLVPPRGSEFEADLIQAVLDGLCPNVRSTRSVPAQIAVAFGAESFFARSDTAFRDDYDFNRLRHVAVNRLGDYRPSLQKAARQRKFAVGQKGSTFPWANTATALHEAQGSCWLSSQIAILGAASGFRLGLSRRPDFPPFGPEGHPASLLELVVKNANSVDWWKSQLLSIPESAKPEWALSLWCAGSPNVIKELFKDWETVMLGLPEPRRRPVIDVALACSARGILQPLPLRLNSDDVDISKLLTDRCPNVPDFEISELPFVVGQPEVVSPLLSVAREQRWFRVDNGGQYR